MKSIFDEMYYAHWQRIRKLLLSNRPIYQRGGKVKLTKAERSAWLQRLNAAIENHETLTKGTENAIREIQA